jgi:alternate signal-mediated exported protein
MKKLRRMAPAIGIVLICLIAIIGGTFAYFTQTSSASNFLSANAYNSELTETFMPPQDGNFTPGVEIDKVVGVTNTGDVSMLVRIKYEEFWDNIPVSLTYADSVSDGETPPRYWYDGDTEVDSVVAKLAGDTTVNPLGNWVYGGDGWYYFLARLDADDVTDPFIEAIMLKASTVETSTTFTVVFWDADLEGYTAEATFANEAAYLAALALLDEGSYISSIVTNQIATYDQLGLYELKFTVQTVQAVSEPAALWQATVTVAAVETFLDDFIITP